MEGIKSIINELSTTFPKFKFSNVRETYSVDAIINVKVKVGEADLAYYGGDSCGYCVLNQEFYTIKKMLQAKLPNCRVIDFIDGKRSGHFELKIY